MDLTENRASFSARARARVCMCVCICVCMCVCVCVCVCVCLGYFQTGDWHDTLYLPPREGSLAASTSTSAVGACAAFTSANGDVGRYENGTCCCPPVPKSGCGQVRLRPTPPFHQMRRTCVKHTSNVRQSLTDELSHRGSPRLSIEQECQARGESGPCAQLDDGRYDDGTCCCPAVPGYVVFMYPCGTCLFIFLCDVSVLTQVVCYCSWFKLDSNAWTIHG